MDREQKYFYITINFCPDYSKTFMHTENDIYTNVLTGEQFRKRLLYDFGWGQEPGFERIPALTFYELIELVENSVVTNKKKRLFEKRSREEMRHNDVSRSNLFGAISVIMQDHVEELIDFLACKVKTDYFSDPVIRENYMWFSFSTNKMREIGFFPGAILTKSYEDVLNEHEQWKKIAKTVIEQVYR